MPTIYWSKSKPGFYHDDVMPKSAMPTDVVVVAQATFQTLLAGQTSTQTIGSDANGSPILVAVS